MNEQNLINLKDRTEQERKEIALKGGKANAVKWKQIKEQRKELAQKEKDFYKQCESTDFLTTFQNYIKSTKDIVINKPHYIGKDENGNKLYSTYEIEKGTIEQNLIISLIDNANDVEDKENAFKYAKLLSNLLKDAQSIELKKQKLALEMELKKQKLEFSKQIKLKELELEERSIKAKEELIRIKQKGVIDIASDEKEQALNLLLNNELNKDIEEQEKEG